jgi:hypothetical protein
MKKTEKKVNPLTKSEWLGLLQASDPRVRQMALNELQKYN